MSDCPPGFTATAPGWYRRTDGTCSVTCKAGRGLNGRRTWVAWGREDAWIGRGMTAWGTTAEAALRGVLARVAEELRLGGLSRTERATYEAIRRLCEEAAKEVERGVPVRAGE